MLLAGGSQQERGLRLFLGCRPDGGKQCDVLQQQVASCVLLWAPKGGSPVILRQPPPPTYPQGALVVRHRLSFQQRIEAAVARNPSDPRLARLEHLAASYARWDVPAIMEKVAGQWGLALSRFFLLSHT